MRLLIIFLFSLISFGVASAQDADTSTMRKGAPKVFINCENCDVQYFKNEIAYLNFVRDRRLADVVVLIRSINTGSGGTEYTLEFTGENEYKDIKATKQFNSVPNMSNSDVRSGLKNVLCDGALCYLIKSPLASKIKYSVSGLEEKGTADKVKDKWNLWLFNVNGSVNGNGQAYSKTIWYNYKSLLI